MSVTPEEAAAIAIGLAILCRATEPQGKPQPQAWARVDDPRTWTDFARREALQIDV